MLIFQCPAVGACVLGIQKFSLLSCKHRLIGLLKQYVCKISPLGSAVCMGFDDNVFTPVPERALLSSKIKLVSEQEVTRRAETILIMDSSHFKGAKLLFIRWGGVNLLGFMNMLILWRLGNNCRAGIRFCWVTLRSACKSPVQTPVFCIMYTEEHFAAFSL